MLKLAGVSASYGSVPAIHDVSIEIGEGEAVGLLGANGAGKSTTLRAISGLVKLSAGNIIFADSGNQIVSRLNADGTISVLAGNGIRGLVKNSFRSLDH